MGSSVGKGGKEAVRNYMPDDIYDGNENLEDVIAEGGFDRPFWWPAVVDTAFSHAEYDRNATVDKAQDVEDYKLYWSPYVKNDSDGGMPSRICDRKIQDTLMGLAPYCGFGGGSGIDKAVYFIDTAANTFGPVRAYLQNRRRHGQDGNNRQLVATTPRIFNTLLLLCRGEVAGGREWVEAVRDGRDHCDPPPGASRFADEPSRMEWMILSTWAVIAGCLRLMDRHHRLFVETPGNASNVSIRTPMFLEHSGEDWNRAIMLWRWFCRRRNAKKYQTAGKKRPSGNSNNKSFVLCWYDGEASVRRGVERQGDRAAEMKFQMFAMRVRPQVQAAGLDGGTRSEEYESYRDLDRERQKEFAFLHAEAIERYRVQLYADGRSANRIDSLPKMSLEEEEMLCDLLSQRVEKLEATTGPTPTERSTVHKDRILGAVTRANENEPYALADGICEDQGNRGGTAEQGGIYVPGPDEFLDDADVMADKARRDDQRRRDDYVNMLDQTFGGNDTNDLTVEEAEALTGWTVKDPRVNPSEENSLRLMPHQIVDVAQVVRKLSVFPNTALLASSCGIGKTNINLGAIVQMNRRCLARYKSQVSQGLDGTDRVKFRPSLILCPASLVMDTYSEAVRSYPDDLIPRIYYGAASDQQASTAAQQAVVPKESLPSVLRGMRDDNPETAKYVFISSYYTFMKRSMRVDIKRKGELSSKDRAMLGLNLMINPTKKNQGPIHAEVEEVEGDIEMDPDEIQVRRQLELEAACDGEWTARDDLKEASDSNAHRDTYKIYSPAYDQTFNVLVLDEAHLVKNRASNLHRMAKTIRRDHLILCTATPMLNNPTDVLSYAVLAWPEAEGHPLPHAFSFNSFYGPAAEWLGYKPQDDPRDKFFRVGGTLDRELARASPEQREVVLQRYVTAEPREDGCCRPLVSRREFAGDRYEDIVGAGSRPWVVNPVHFYWACREFNSKGSFDACRKVVREMLSALIVKRGMQTKLLLPDGTAVTPSDGLLGACFRIVNVRFKPEQQREYLGLYDAWKPDMYCQPGEGTGSRAAKRIRIGTFRHLLLPAFNLINRKLLDPKKDTVALVKALGVSVERGTGQRAPKQVPMGAEHSRILAVDTEDGGAQWLFEALKAGPEHMMPNNRFEFVYWLAYHSPIMAQLILQVREWIGQPRQGDLPNRVVVMAAMPWVQQDVALCLKMYGWNVSSIRADMDVFERNKVIAEFNNPSAEVDVMLTSMNLSAFGLNFHKACHKGIVVQWPWSANYLMQILGRLPRIGQKRYVEWVIYTMPGTLYDKMQTIVWSKYARQLAVESRIHESVRGVLADIASYTLLFNLFSMPHHRWLWDRTAFDLDIDGSIDPCERPQKLSVFFQQVGQMAVSSVPERSSSDFEAFNDLCDRGAEDFVAGAVLWLRDERPRLSWGWLSARCSIEKIRDDLGKPWISEYLDEILRRALLDSGAHVPSRLEGDDRDAHGSRPRVPSSTDGEGSRYRKKVRLDGRRGEAAESE